MKYLKSHNNFINESLRDKLKGKSEEEVKSKLKGLSPKELLIKSAQYGYMNGVKTAIKSIFSSDIIKEPFLNSKLSKSLNISLYRAVENNNYDIAKLLLDLGLSNPNSEYYDILQEAVNNDNYDIVKLLIDNGVDVNGNDQDAFTAAFFIGNYDIIKLFLESGVDPQCKNNMPMKILRNMEFADGPIKDLLQSYIDKLSR